MPFEEIICKPSSVTVETDTGTISLDPSSDRYAAAGVEVTCVVGDRKQIDVAVTSETAPLRKIHLRWDCSPSADTSILGDHWERGYGDLEWRPSLDDRPMPWYFMTYDGVSAHGYGVKTGAGAFCHWRMDSTGISLWMDVCCGGMGVVLSGRMLPLATVVAREGVADGESPFAATHAFCRMMCDSPRFMDHKVYGSNNWYYAYGNSSSEDILSDTDLLMSLSPSLANRPYMTIDDGWQPSELVDGCRSGSLWQHGNSKFKDMARLAASIKERGARPGLWMRPLAACASDQDSVVLPMSRMASSSEQVRALDPSIPENLERIVAHLQRIRDWGYELVKHDFSTFDMLGCWGFDMGSRLTNPGWSFRDRSRTTAEIILDLYRAVRKGVGSGIVIGCNTVGHLGAGIFELQRTGDDTSGREWERTRKMGVNTLAFRMPQHGTFFEADADCVGVTNNVPWERNRLWLDLLARSGTPLFVSADPKAIGPVQKAAISAAFGMAARAQSAGEPLDWLETTCPASWKLGGEIVAYDWCA